MASSAGGAGAAGLSRHRRRRGLVLQRPVRSAAVADGPSGAAHPATPQGQALVRLNTVARDDLQAMGMTSMKQKTSSANTRCHLTINQGDLLPRIVGGLQHMPMQNNDSHQGGALVHTACHSVAELLRGIRCPSELEVLGSHQKRGMAYQERGRAATATSGSSQSSHRGPTAEMRHSLGRPPCRDGMR